MRQVSCSKSEFTHSETRMQEDACDRRLVLSVSRLPGAILIAS
jgi:hypothetical protein